MKIKYNSIKIIKITIMFILSFIMLFPFLLMLITSLKTTAEINTSTFVFIPKQIVWMNYVTAMSRGHWDKYFWNSIFITTVTVSISLLLNSITGYAFARLEFKGRNTLFLISLVGMMIPAQVTMIPLFIILKNFPLAGGNDILGQGGIGLINSYAGMYLPYIAGAFGVFMFRQFYLNFPKALDDAAKIDGLGRVGTFYYIYVPLSTAIFATLAALKSTATWTEYTWPLIITNKDSMKTVQLALAMFKSENDMQWNLLMAATTLITLPLIIIFLFAQKYFVDGITTAGIKG